MQAHVAHIVAEKDQVAFHQHFDGLTDAGDPTHMLVPVAAWILSASVAMVAHEGMAFGAIGDARKQRLQQHLCWAGLRRRADVGETHLPAGDELDRCVSHCGSLLPR